MKRALAWIAGLAGIAALGRHLSRRAAASAQSTEVPEGAAGDPAEELRGKLAGQRVEAPDASTEPETIEARRARVHAKAQEAIGEMDEENA